MDQNKQKHTLPVVMSIAGSDSSGGAGVSADLKTFMAFDCYGVQAITAVTAQNSTGVQAQHIVPADIVAQQMRSLFEDFSVKAVKIGMVGTAENVEAIAEELKRWGGGTIVVDTPFVASTGQVLADEVVREAIVSHLFPHATLITPNLEEAAFLLNLDVAKSTDEMIMQAHALVKFGGGQVLLKGGHLEGEKVVDVLTDGNMEYLFSRQRLNASNNHGTGCALSAAIAAGLASGKPINEAVERATDWLGTVLAQSSDCELTSGTGPLIIN